VEVAWNQLRLDNFTQKDVQRILSEISILESLRDENIINLFYSWVIRAKDNVSIEKVCFLFFTLFIRYTKCCLFILQVIFITELMTSGTLKNYLKKTKGSVNRKTLVRWYEY
jgi:WNK lysine deficient protein kinase